MGQALGWPSHLAAYCDRVTSLCSATRTSATSTPRPVQPPPLPQRTPSPAPKSKPPLGRSSSHKRQLSETSNSESSQLLAQPRLEQAQSASGELPGRAFSIPVSHSGRTPNSDADGYPSSSHTPFKVSTLLIFCTKLQRRLVVFIEMNAG